MQPNTESQFVYCNKLLWRLYVNVGYYLGAQCVLGTTIVHFHPRPLCYAVLKFVLVIKST